MSLENTLLYCLLSKKWFPKRFILPASLFKDNRGAFLPSMLSYEMYPSIEISLICNYEEDL
jgi:hypothetical protein